MKKIVGTMLLNIITYAVYIYSSHNYIKYHN